MTLISLGQSSHGLMVAVANKEWYDLHTSMEVSIFAARTSYHLPLLLILKKGKGGKQRRDFRFEVTWAKNMECRAIIKK